VSEEPCVVGVDFGTLSGRAVVVRVSDGAELASAEHVYAHAVLDRSLPDGTRLSPDWALQVPSDYIDVLRGAVPEAMTRAGVRPEQVIGIGTDFTACTVLPVLADGTPLCELPGLENRPHAYVKLWCHHAAQGQADRINTLAAEMKEPWLERAVRREDLLGGGLHTHSPTLATNPHTRAHFPGSAGQRYAHSVPYLDAVTLRVTGRGCDTSPA